MLEEEKKHTHTHTFYFVPKAHIQGSGSFFVSND